MKNIIIRDLTDFVSDSYLHMNSFGFLLPTASPYGILRQNGRSDYQMLYVQSGWMEVEIRNGMKRLCAGECMFYFPGEKQYYTFSPEGNSMNYWIHFTGTAVPEILSAASITESSILSVHSRTQFEGILHQLLHTYTLQKATHQQEEKCLLLQLITLLTADSCPDCPDGSDHIYSVAGYICEHYKETTDIDRLASMTHLSRSRFSHLFTELIGYSPYHYLQRIRMDKARDMLLLSSLSISDVAENVGFSDPLYFSRIFKKYYGLSPQIYRKTHRDNPEIS